MFSPKTKQNVTKSKEPTKTVNKNLFGSDEEDLFDRALPTKSATGADVNKDDLFCDKEVKKVCNFFCVDCLFLRIDVFLGTCSWIKCKN